MMGWEKNSEVREVDELLWEHSEKYFFRHLLQFTAKSKQCQDFIQRLNLI